MSPVALWRSRRAEGGKSLKDALARTGRKPFFEPLPYTSIEEWIDKSKTSPLWGEVLPGIVVGLTSNAE